MSRPPGQRRASSGACNSQRPIADLVGLFDGLATGGFDAAREAEEVFHVRTVVTICCFDCDYVFGEIRLFSGEAVLNHVVMPDG